MTTLRGMLHDRLTTAMRNKDEQQKSLLRLVIGECQLFDARAGGCGTLQADDMRTASVIRKLVESNNKTIEQVVDHDPEIKELRDRLEDLNGQPVDDAVVVELQDKLKAASDTVKRYNPHCTKLRNENEYLEGLLPSVLSTEEISLNLIGVAEGIKAAKSQGAAIGVAMKHLKGNGITNVNATDVATVVEQLRK